MVDQGSCYSLLGSFLFECCREEESEFAEERWEASLSFMKLSRRSVENPGTVPETVIEALLSRQFVVFG